MACRHRAGQRRRRRDRQIEVADDHDDRLSARDDRQDGHLVEDVAHVREAEEDVRPHREEEDDQHDQGQHRAGRQKRLSHRPARDGSGIAGVLQSRVTRRCHLNPPFRSSTPAGLLRPPPTAATSTGDPALVHDQDPVAHADQLRQLRADGDHRRAAGGEFADQAIDLRLGSDVDASRRLVHQQHLGLAGQHLGQHDLLLIAAGQLAHRLPLAPRLDLQVGHPLARRCRRCARPRRRRTS